MYYNTIPPPPHLAHVIRFFWVLEGDKGYTHYNMADACVEMLFHYRGLFDEVTDSGNITRSYTSGIHGPSHTLRRYTIDAGFSIFGVYFYPQAVPLLLGISAADMANNTAELKDLLKGEGRILEERIMLAKNNQ